MAYVITEDCIACGTCIDECPVGAISECDSYYVIDNNICVECEVCVDVCPCVAIKLDNSMHAFPQNLDTRISQREIDIKEYNRVSQPNIKSSNE